MKKHVVFIVGSYGKYMSPGANIAKSIWEELKGQYDISVIRHLEHIDDTEIAPDQCFRVYTVKDSLSCFHHNCLQKKKQSGVLYSAVYSFLLLIKKMITAFRMLLSNHSYIGSLMRKELKTLKKIHSESAIDMIIPVSEPHSAVFAAMKFCEEHSETHYMPYQLDRYANGNSFYILPRFQKKLRKNNLAAELKVLNSCDKLFVLPPIYPHYIEPMFDALRNKIIITEHPLVRDRGLNSVCTQKAESDQGVIMYAGSLCQHLRNPIYWFRMLEKALNRHSEWNIQCNFFSFGDCENIVEEFSKRLHGKIVQKGRHPYSVVTEEYLNCNYILIIGNNSKEEVPSKIFDCISFGKPIIYLAYSVEDPSIPYFEGNELVLCLLMDEDTLDANCEKVYQFCKRHINSMLTSKKICSLYEKCTPPYVAKQFLEQIQ